MTEKPAQIVAACIVMYCGIILIVASAIGMIVLDGGAARLAAGIMGGSIGATAVSATQVMAWALSILMEERRG